MFPRSVSISRVVYVKYPKWVVLRTEVYKNCDSASLKKIEVKDIPQILNSFVGKVKSTADREYQTGWIVGVDEAFSLVDGFYCFAQFYEFYYAGSKVCKISGREVFWC